MRYDILFAPEAVEDLENVAANFRAEVRDCIESHLRHELRKTSKSRIKRLRGYSRWFDYRLEHDPRFLRRMERARQSLREGKGVRIEDLNT